MANDEWEIMESAKNFWSPKEIGEELVGEIVEITSGLYGSRYVVRTDKGDISTPSHKVLQNRLANASVGDVVKIIYKGTQPPAVRGQNPTAIYEVFRKKAPKVTEEKI